MNSLKHPEKYKLILKLHKPPIASTPPPVQVQKLINYGNTCFVNSALQALASFDDFRKYLSMSRGHEECVVSSVLLEDLDSLKNPISDYAIRAKLNAVEKVSSYFIEDEEQHDSSEFITFLMDWVDEEIKLLSKKLPLIVNKNFFSVHDDVIGEADHYQLAKSTDYKKSRETTNNQYNVCTRKRVKPVLTSSTSLKSSSSSIPLPVEAHNPLEYSMQLETKFKPNPFSGILRSSLTCRKDEGHISYTHSNFLHLSVPIRNTLEICFDEYTREENVEWKCEICKEERLKKEEIDDEPEYLSYAVKQLSIAHPPRILCVHFQRLVSGQPGYGGFEARKSEQRVKFGLKFNISPYCSGGLAQRREGKLISSQSSAINYDLQAIIVHLGGSTGGHYVTYKRFQASSWVLISDSEWREVSQEEALSQKAFMLFYIKAS
jgi:ubiquitin carboxyl-terminal hydrolase 1